MMIDTEQKFIVHFVFVLDCKAGPCGGKRSKKYDAADQVRLYLELTLAVEPVIFCHRVNRRAGLDLFAVQSWSCSFSLPQTVGQSYVL